MTAARSTLPLLLLTFLVSTAVEAAPLLTFQPNGVAVSGITPKAGVYVYSLSREATGTFTDVVPREIMLTDDDGDGIVVWTLEREVANRSIWLAVDLSNGAPTVGTPGGYAATRVDLSDGHLKKDFGAEARQLAFDGDFVEFIVVRPGTGTWRGTASRRGTADEGTDPERPTVSVEKLEATLGGKEAAPRHLQRGDVVLMINSFRAAYGLAVIGEQR
ncbi:MAG TPA: hypothetical protein VGF28_08430 [Thermoanaerobaculia bacterium]|jgi:hypothetical protein